MAKTELATPEVSEAPLSPEILDVVVQSDEALARTFLSKREGEYPLEVANMEDDADRLDFAKEAILEAYLDPKRGHEDAISIAQRFAKTDTDTYMPPSVDSDAVNVADRMRWDIDVSEGGSIKAEVARGLRADLLPLNIVHEAATAMRWRALGVERESLDPQVATQVETSFAQARAANEQLVEAQAVLSGVITPPAA